jgi:dolichol kinase
VDRGRGYNRKVRKLLHIAGGLFAFALPYLPYWLVCACVFSAGAIALWLKPTHYKWVRYVSKPADRYHGKIHGMRVYAAVVVLLVLSWGAHALADGKHPLELFAGFRTMGEIDPLALRYLMAGWLAMALGDGLAGILGPGPRVARTVPWNRHKTWWGTVGAFIGVFAACALSLLWPMPGDPAMHRPIALSLSAVVGLLGALLESFETQLDDNYLVGLGIPFILLILVPLAQQF